MSSSTRCAARCIHVPPREVVTALLTLLDGAVPDRIAVDYESQDQSSINNEATHWKIVALAQGAVVTLSAFHRAAGWTWENDAPSARWPQIPPSIKAELRSVRQVAYLKVDKITDLDDNTFSGWKFQPQWGLAFRDGTDVVVKASAQTSTARDECAAIAGIIRDALVSAQTT